MLHDDEAIAPHVHHIPPRHIQSHGENSESSLSTLPDTEQKYGWQIDTSEFDNIDSSKGVRVRSRAGPSLFSLSRQRTHTALGGRIKLRPDEDDEPTDWWFASTAIPLIVATFAPMANMLSIAALVVSWRMDVTTNDALTRYSTALSTPDPQWLLDLNGASLACGFVGNAFLLFNFTRKVRYIIALPVSIVLFYVACGILAGITAGMHIYTPASALQVYSQGYWHAIIAACLYLLCAVLLMVNMLGYFLGHYNQHFDLNDEQRNLILQTMIFFIWLAGGGAVFAKLEGWTYPDGLYFGDVTLLTIGFGDYFATNDLGRGLIFPFSVGGTIILGLMVSSIHRFAQELSKENVVKKHVETRRVNTLSRVVTEESQIGPNGRPIDPSTTISRPLEADQIQRDLDEKAKLEKAMSRTIGFHVPTKEERIAQEKEPEAEPAPNQFKFQKDPEKRNFFRTLTLDNIVSVGKRIPIPNRHQKAIMMRNEKDRFDRMRQIQYDAARFKKWYALTLSIIAFGLLWCVGAMVFYFAEASTQQLSYFEALYFCYVSLLTIGYGDLSPKSNAGKAFFVLWSLIAVPTITILVSDLGDTVIGGFKRRVLKYGGLAFLGKGRGWGLDWFIHQKSTIQRRLSVVGLGHTKAAVLEAQSLGKRSENNNATDVDEDQMPMTVEQLAEEQISEPVMMRRLAYALRRVADDMRNHPDKRYSYEEWVEYSRLIRFTRLKRDVLQDEQAAQRQLEYDEAVDGIIEWDWLDHKSPMTSEQSESEWLLDRLLESLLRSFRKSDLLAAVSAHHSHHEHTAHAAHDNPEHSDHRHHSHLHPNSSNHPYQNSAYEDRGSRMSISEARRHSSISSSTSRNRHRASPVSSGDSALANRKSTDEPVLESDEEDDPTRPGSGWSRRGQARIAARQSRRKSLAEHSRNGTARGAHNHPHHSPPHSPGHGHGHGHGHQIHARTKYGSAAVAFEHHKAKMKKDASDVVERLSHESPGNSNEEEEQQHEQTHEQDLERHAGEKEGEMARGGAGGAEVVATSKHGKYTVEVPQRPEVVVVDADAATTATATNDSSRGVLGSSTLAGEKDVEKR